VRTGAQELVVVLLLSSCVPVLTQELRFADVLFAPSRAGDKARGCCVIRAGEITATGVTVRQMIEAAYRRHAFDRREVIGGPAWIDEDRFDFTARVAGGHLYDRSGFPAATFATMRAHANQNARIHTEMRERQVYALVPISGRRPALVPSTADCAAQMRAVERQEPISGRPCGASPYPRRLMATGITMADLASLITPWVDRIVIDRTGLPGSFDVDLEGVEVKPAGPFGPSYRPSETKRSIFEHLEKQLGLRLERMSSQVEIVVVDSVEKPSRGY
jgi:uncharacterized protein (TIGR03435 family)